MPPGALCSAPMSTNTTARESYGDWLARKMEEGGWSQRSLARAWNPDAPENARRSLKRYLKGVEPITRTREEIAKVLGSEESGPGETEEEGGYDPISILRARLAAIQDGLAEVAETVDQLAESPAP